MNGKLNIDIDKVREMIFEHGKQDRMILTEMQEENFKKAAEILAQNEFDCRKFVDLTSDDTMLN